MRLTVTIALAFLLVLGVPVAHAEDTSANAPAVDLSKIMGTWYVIARMPNAVERGHVTSRDEYTLVENGKVAVRYLYRDGFGEPERSQRARLSGCRQRQPRLAGVVLQGDPGQAAHPGNRPDGSWMLISYPGRDLAWIFARKPDMSRDQYRMLVNKMRDDYSIYTDKLKRVQLREQVDRLGFEVPNKR